MIWRWEACPLNCKMLTLSLLAFLLQLLPQVLCLDCFKCTYAKTSLTKIILAQVIKVSEDGAQTLETPPAVTYSAMNRVQEDFRCRDEFNLQPSGNNVLQNCTSCMKLKLVTADNLVAVARLCSDMPSENHCTDMADQGNHVVTCTCNGHLCNHAPGPQHVRLTAALVTARALLLTSIIQLLLRGGATFI